jgi:hypothetical protein
MTDERPYIIEGLLIGSKITIDGMEFVWGKCPDCCSYQWVGNDKDVREFGWACEGPNNIFVGENENCYGFGSIEDYVLQCGKNRV